MFINYWFIIFAVIFFPVFWLTPIPTFRKSWLLLACMIFHYRFAGAAGVIPIIIMGILTYFAGLSANKIFRISVIIVCVLELIFYKYSLFFLTQALNFINPSMTDSIIATAKKDILPLAPPLAISFFVFEFVHYLTDVQRGKPPIKSVADFTLFSIFWPSVVSGPIKRFEQFLPAVKAGCQKINSNDIQLGMLRIIVGLIKKMVIAENLTRYIDFWQPQFVTMDHYQRWLLVLAISLRILFDFSGYSDMAIGFARMMGIKIPENFRWPYLATSVQDFWQRWHISLSSWIRDYIYIPLGGNKHGNLRKFSNGIVAFAICGLWHGAAFNFIFWGVYHGLGLVISSNIQSLFHPLTSRAGIIFKPIGWSLTFVFVSLGWLYFFYPLKEANLMLKQLFY